MESPDYKLDDFERDFLELAAEKAGSLMAESQRLAQRAQAVVTHAQERVRAQAFRRHGIAEGAQVARWTTDASGVDGFVLAPAAPAPAAPPLPEPVSKPARPEPVPQ